MFERFNPDTIMEPYGGNYSHGLVIPPGASLMFVSGQIGETRDATMLEGIEAQTRQVWENIGAVLQSAGFGYGDIVKINSYVARRSEYAAYAAVRREFLGDLKPAMTGIIVELAAEEMLVEVEVIAAKMP
jgi:2-iminobutanoate/2-iminopropanoate deaminase